MSDTTLNRFVAYGTTAQRNAFTPSPPTPSSGPSPGYLWWDTDLQTEFAYNFGSASWVSTGGGGSAVTASGTLTNQAVILGGGTSVISALGSLGTTTTVLHGNAAGAPTFAAVSLTADTTGILPASQTGGRVLLESQTASASTTLDFGTRNAAGMSGNTFQSDYDDYEIEFVNLVVDTTNISVLLRVKTVSGFDSGSNYDTAMIRFSSAGNGAGGGASATSVDLTGGATINNTAAEGGLTGFFKIYTPTSASAHKRFVGATSYRTTTPATVGISISGSYKATTALTSFQVLTSSGAAKISTGVVRIYGMGST